MNKRSMRLPGIITILALGVAAGAQTGAAAAAGPKETPAVGALAGEMQAPLTELDRKLKTMVSVDFRETPIDDVIRALTAQAKIDIVKSPQVTGTVTATLTDVPLGEALDTILSVNNYGYVASENIIRVVPRTELQAQIRMETKIFRICYTDIKEVEKTIKEMLTSNGKIAVSPATSHVVITDQDSQMKVIDQAIQEMDRELPQILVEARIYDLSLSNALDLGFEWYGSRRTIFDPDTGAVLSGKTDPFMQGLFDSGISRTPKTDALLRTGVLNNYADIDVKFTAESEDVKAKLLANPKILVVDNQKANIKIISEIPYQELTQTSGGGNIGTTQFKEVGVQLEVTPHVTREGKIRMVVKPTFSVQTDSVSIIIPVGNQVIQSPQPVIDKREETTTALIRDGQTVVIGGLRKKESIKEVSKVPLLGDIPLLGWFFTYEGSRDVNSELVVFITPRIVSTPELSAREAKQLDMMESEFFESTPFQELRESEPAMSGEQEEK
jgi:type IV pilus secretin PilQ/predicted competence protein